MGEYLYVIGVLAISAALVVGGIRVALWIGIEMYRSCVKQYQGERHE